MTQTRSRAPGDEPGDEVPPVPQRPVPRVPDHEVPDLPQDAVPDVASDEVPRTPEPSAVGGEHPVEVTGAPDGADREP